MGCLGKKKSKRKIMYSSHHSGEFENYNMVLYEPVVQVENFKYRTLVLIGMYEGVGLIGCALVLIGMYEGVGLISLVLLKSDIVNTTATLATSLISLLLSWELDY